MTEKLLRILPFALGIFVIVNLLALDFFWVTSKKPEEGIVKAPAQKEKEVTPTPLPLTTPIPGAEVSCTDECLQAIEERVNEAVAKITPAATQQVVVTQAPAQQTQQASILYLPLGGLSSETATSWTDIGGSDFYFDKADYSNLSEARWEGSMRSFLGGNKVYARLYDVTNKRAVDSSELSTDSSSWELVRSAALSIWAGNNLYRIQAKSSAGTPVYIDSPRLKIILK